MLVLLWMPYLHKSIVQCWIVYRGNHLWGYCVNHFLIKTQEHSLEVKFLCNTSFCTKFQYWTSVFLSYIEGFSIIHWTYLGHHILTQAYSYWILHLVSSCNYLTNDITTNLYSLQSGYIKLVIMWLYLIWYI